MNKHDPLLNFLFYIILLVAVVYIHFSFDLPTKIFEKHQNYRINLLKNGCHFLRTSFTMGILVPHFVHLPSLIPFKVTE